MPRLIGPNPLWLMDGSKLATSGHFCASRNYRAPRFDFLVEFLIETVVLCEIIFPRGGFWTTEEERLDHLDSLRSSPFLPYSLWQSWKSVSDEPRLQSPRSDGKSAIRTIDHIFLMSNGAHPCLPWSELPVPTHVASPQRKFHDLPHRANSVQSRPVILWYPRYLFISSPGISFYRGGIIVYIIHETGHMSEWSYPASGLAVSTSIHLWCCSTPFAAILIQMCTI